MTTTSREHPIILKNNQNTGTVPAAEELVLGEVAINTADGILYSKKNDGSVAEIGTGSSLVRSVAGRMGDVVLTKNDVGLNNIDNTSDLEKPISNNVQTILNTKAETNHQHSYSNFNTGVGLNSAISINTGSRNTSMGADAFSSNTTGSNNVCFGTPALWQNTVGSNNTSVGAWTMIFNTSGSDSVAVGTGSLSNNVNGSSNTAIGSASLFNNTTGINNIAIGAFCGVNNVTGSNNTIIGFGADANDNFNNCIVLGSGAVADRSGQLVIGSSSSAIGTTSSVGTTGSASLLPARPLGYLQMRLNGVLVKIPYYRE